MSTFRGKGERPLKEDRITLYNVGDIILGPDPEPLFSEVRKTLEEADVLVGQLEVPHTTRDAEAMALGRHPDNLSPLVTNGFDLVTMAGNHLMDAGPAGVEDTIAWLDARGIAHVGAGMNLSEARRPAVLERKGVRIGYLDYNCVGPKKTWASEQRPGNAYVHVVTHYELDHDTPGGPPVIYTWATMESTEAMAEDIRALRERCDVLVVAFHKGIAHTPVKIAQYERQVARAAVDAGADLVVAHHAHILKGIEIYRGKTIFHGLGNFVTWAPFLAPSPDGDPDSWAMRRIELFGFRPDPEYPTYPFHPEAIYTMIAVAEIEDGRIVRTGYKPCIVNKAGKPVPVSRKDGGETVFAYVEDITRKAGLNARFAWASDDFAVCLEGE